MPHHKPMLDPLRVPKGFSTDTFIVRQLLHTDNSLDYEAWHNSIEHLRGALGPQSPWPLESMTVEENLIDLAWHEVEHKCASLFAFTVMAPDEKSVIGCIYISPPRKAGDFDAEIIFWVTKEQYDAGLEKTLEKSLRKWLHEEWPFKSCIFPGRDLSWAEYLQLEDAVHW